MPKIHWKYLVSARARAVLKASKARDRQNPHKAADLYRHVIARWGATFPLLMQYGNALKDSGAYDEAEQAYGEALAMRPDEADIFLQRGHLMKLKGDLALAKEYYIKASKLDPLLQHAKNELDGLQVRLRSFEPETNFTLRSDMPFSASVVYLRIRSHYRWRRG